jgi:hypothetical protein
MSNQYNALPPAYTLPASPSNSYVGMQQRVNPQSAQLATPIIMPDTPIITLGAVGNSTITIDVTNHAANASSLHSYIVYVNGSSYGNFVAVSNAIKITGLPNNREYRIRIKAVAATYSGSSAGAVIGRYGETSFSNQVSGTPSLTLAARSSPSMNTNKVDVKYVSSNTFANCSLVGTSQYSERYYGDNQVYLSDPVYFRNNFLLGSFNAEIKFKARFHHGGNDRLYGGEVFGIFSDVNIDLNPLPFSTLLSYDADVGEDVSDVFAGRILELDQSLVTTDPRELQAGLDHFDVDIASQLKREFILSRPYIAEKLRKYIKNNFNSILRSADTMRAYLDVTNFNTPGISTSFKDFMLPYEGLVFITPHIIASTLPAGVNETTTFSYKMVDSNNVTQFTKENVSASIVLASPQTADSFTFQELKPIKDQSDIFGPTSSELGSPNITT